MLTSRPGGSNLKEKSLKIISIFLLGISLFQLPFSNQVFCIELNGQVEIEVVSFGKCDILPKDIASKSDVYSPSYGTHNETACFGCLDIPLNQNFISKTTLESDVDKFLKLPRLIVLNELLAPYSLPQFVIQNTKIQFDQQSITSYHPYMSLKTTILLI